MLPPARPAAYARSMHGYLARLGSLKVSLADGQKRQSRQRGRGSVSHRRAASDASSTIPHDAAKRVARRLLDKIFPGSTKMAAARVFFGPSQGTPGKIHVRSGARNAHCDDGNGKQGVSHGLLFSTRKPTTIPGKVDGKRLKASLSYRRKSVCESTEATYKVSSTHTGRVIETTEHRHYIIILTNGFEGQLSIGQRSEGPSRTLLGGQSLEVPSVSKTSSEH